MPVPIVNPVVVAYGDTIHITPIDQTETPIPIDQCTLLNLPPSIATWTKDETGFSLIAVAPGGYAGVQIEWSDGVNPALRSTIFTVTVVAPDAAVTEIGSTTP